jgi:hypothetical protein
MNCPHCNSPARDDWPCEFRCGSITHIGGEFYRSIRCFGNEIEQLRATIKTMEMGMMNTGGASKLLGDCKTRDEVIAWLRSDNTYKSGCISISAARFLADVMEGKL